MGNLSKSLKDAVRKLAYNTSVDSLKKRGVKNVNVLGIDRVVSLIEDAVHASLRNRLMAVDREEVADAAKEEFIRLFRANQDLKRSKGELERKSIEALEEAAALRHELDTAKHELDERLAEAEEAERQRFEGDNEALADQVRAVFAKADEDGLDARAVQKQIASLVIAAAEHEREHAKETASSEKDGAIEQLERRIRKLTKSLEVTERRLQEVASLKDVDSGLSSIYREVQGLSSGEANYEKKKELMADIFKANMVLQKGSD